MKIFLKVDEAALIHSCLVCIAANTEIGTITILGGMAPCARVLIDDNRQRIKRLAKKFLVIKENEAGSSDTPDPK